MGAAALPIAAMAMQAAGTMMGAAQESKQLKREARQDRENGRLSLAQGEQDAMDVLRQARFDQGAAAADMAGSGLAFGGSIGAVLADSAYQAEADIDRIRARAVGEANNYYANAAQKKKAAKAAIAGGIFSAVSNAVGQASGMKSQGALQQQGVRERAVRLGGGGGQNTLPSGSGNSLVDPRLYGMTPQPNVKY